ncbi:MAG TPA: DUF4190 domain-containing protein [Acidimicrobiia bacterium]
MSFPTDAAYPEESQATTILVIGILSLVCSCFPLGIAAWIMGNKEIAAIDAGMRNPQNRQTANAGRIIGIIATVLGSIGIILLIIWALVGITFVSFDQF